jgi:uncharacterized membrane protein
MYKLLLVLLYFLCFCLFLFLFPGSEIRVLSPLDFAAKSAVINKMEERVLFGNTFLKNVVRKYRKVYVCDFINAQLTCYYKGQIAILPNT